MPFRRLSNTAPELLIGTESATDFELERAKLLSALHELISQGPEGCTRGPHAFFGQLTPEQWGALIYKHLDHHLRQFAT